ncbi:hypothetical protein HU200_001794 [Digitaria exilis]|uniref:BHLH domain-containing protein n=1 Tax=Digitaria exilis TaxID=1010633 RepID=A0A835G0F2_9POAL|nr:hypothetical protein HU200_001794 [Digitaria exilis]CAB3497185.1 unnamed protein product [Digitaria exilis]
MALSFHPTTATVLGGHLPPAADMSSSFLHDAHPEVTDALLGFVYDPLDPSNAALDELLSLPLPDNDGEVEGHCAKKQRAYGDHAPAIGAGQQCTIGGVNQEAAPVLPELSSDFVLPLPPLPQQQQQQLPEAVAEAKKGTGNVPSQSVQSAAARQRRKRISEKTAELSRLIPGGHKLNTAEMLEAAARHVKLLQAQVGMLALMRNSTEKEKMQPFMAKEEQMMDALLACGGVQERLAAEGRCLVPTKLVGAMAKDSSVMSHALVNRDLGRFVASLQVQGQ